MTFKKQILYILLGSIATIIGLCVYRCLTPTIYKFEQRLVLRRFEHCWAENDERLVLCEDWNKTNVNRGETCIRTSWQLLDSCMTHIY